MNSLSEVVVGLSLHPYSSLASPIGAKFATEGSQGHVPLLVGLCGLLNSSVHPSPLLIQLLMELQVEVVQNGFLDSQVFNLFSELVISGQDGIEMDSDLARGKQNV